MNSFLNQHWYTTVVWWIGFAYDIVAYIKKCHVMNVECTNKRPTCHSLSNNSQEGNENCINTVVFRVIAKYYYVCIDTFAYNICIEIQIVLYTNTVWFCWYFKVLKDVNILFGFPKHTFPQQYICPHFCTIR